MSPLPASTATRSAMATTASAHISHFVRAASTVPLPRNPSSGFHTRYPRAGKTWRYPNAPWLLWLAVWRLPLGLVFADPLAGQLLNLGEQVSVALGPGNPVLLPGLPDPLLLADLAELDGHLFVRRLALLAEPQIDLVDPFVAAELAGQAAIVGGRAVDDLGGDRQAVERDQDQPEQPVTEQHERAPRRERAQRPPLVDQPDDALLR